MNQLPNFLYLNSISFFSNTSFNSTNDYQHPTFFYPVLGIPIINCFQLNPNNNSQLQETNITNDVKEENKPPKRKFSKEDDEKLKMLVKAMGCKKWKNIAQHMPGRTGRQCRDRYQNYLIPGYFNGQWTKEEDELLIKKHAEIGPKWSKMTEFFKSRNSNSLKNRWNYYLSKHIKDSKYNNEKKIENQEEISEISSVIDYALSLSFTDMDQIEEKDGFNCSKKVDTFLSI